MVATREATDERVKWLYGIVAAGLVAAVGAYFTLSTARDSDTGRYVEKIASDVKGLTESIALIRVEVAVLRATTSQIALQVDTFSKKEIMSRAEIVQMIESKLLSSAPWTVDRDNVLRRLTELETAVRLSKGEPK